MNRKLISKAFTNIDDAFIAETMSPPVGKTDHAPERTKKMGKYENARKRVHSRRLFGLILAACLVFALAITAYAMNLFGIREMFRTQLRELPEVADPYIQQHTETAAAEAWSARITESLCDSSRAMVTVTVSGGDKYIVVPTDATPEHSVGVIGITGDQTLGEYAAAQGKELLCVSASLMQNENLSIFTEAITFVNASDSEMCILVDATRSGGETAGNAICSVYAVDEDGALMKLELPITLEEASASDGGMFVPEEPNAIPGITVGNAQIQETPLGWNVRFMCTVTDQDAFYNILKLESDEMTVYEGGFVLEDDGNWYLIWSMGQGEITDSLTIRFYDCDMQLLGSIVFRKQ